MLKKPFSPINEYTEVHNALFTLYTRLDDFGSDHAFMYTILMSYYNVEYGYAYPTKAELALRMNVGINKPKKVAEVLEKYGLIKCVERDRSKIGTNDIYYVYAPITNEEEFYAKFPQARERYEVRRETLFKRNSTPISIAKESVEPESIPDWL